MWFHDMLRIVFISVINSICYKLYNSCITLPFKGIRIVGNRSWKVSS